MRTRLRMRCTIHARIANGNSIKNVKGMTNPKPLPRLTVGIPRDCSMLNAINPVKLGNTNPVIQIARTSLLLETCGLMLAETELSFSIIMLLQKRNRVGQG